MKIAIATDHTGLNYGGAYSEVKDLLSELGYDYQDFGPIHLNLDDDYPDFIFPAARAVASGECHLGIILGGSGQGEAMAANRIKGVRCAVFYGISQAKNSVDAEGDLDNDPYEIIKLSRQHNLANMLSLATRFLDNNEIKHAIKEWLATAEGSAERHLRRIHKLDDLA